jgi:predicted enzyme related to lactoylglutathione lyase
MEASLLANTPAALPLVWARRYARGAYVALAEGDVYVPAKAGPIVYVQVQNIAGVLERAQSAGAAILLPIRDIGEDGLVAEFEDSEGNRIALNQPR